jgi:hypothetical protein
MMAHDAPRWPTGTIDFKSKRAEGDGLVGSTTVMLPEELREFIQQFQDHLAPKLDTYEQAIYLYVFRHSRFIGKDEAVIGFKSARSRMATGLGIDGTPMSEGSAYRKLSSLKRRAALRSCRQNTKEAASDSICLRKSKALYRVVSQASPKLIWKLLISSMIQKISPFPLFFSLPDARLHHR